jgi:hypothetical protein
MSWRGALPVDGGSGLLDELLTAAADSIDDLLAIAEASDGLRADAMRYQAVSGSCNGAPGTYKDAWSHGPNQRDELDK